MRHTLVFIARCRMWGAACGALLAITTTMPTGPLRAQETALLRGVITDQDRGAPVLGARIFLDSAEVGVTDVNGHFLVTGVPLGEYRLGVRAVGFQPFEAIVHLAATKLYEVEVPIQPGAFALEALTIQAPRLPPNRVGEIFERMQHGSGDFITRADLDEMRPLDTSAALSRSRKVSLNWVNMGDCLDEALFGAAPDVGGSSQNPTTVGSDQSIATAGSTCPWVQRRPGIQVLMGRGTRRCVPNLYLDGIRFQIVPGTLLDDIVFPHDIELIEIYGEFEVPGEYINADVGCGVIAIWTRTG